MTERTEAEQIKEVAKRRGFFLESNEIYGGTAGFYTFGPKGASLKQNLEEAWRDRFTYMEGNMEIDAPTIMPEKVFEASGHLETFDDMIIECPECGESIRADHLVEDKTEIEEAECFSTEKIEDLIKENRLQCESCGEELSGIKVDDFNLMFTTNIGPGDSSPGYLRPETAQGIFVEFPQWKEYARGKLPFGVTQIGKAYRNEISPRKSIVRVREFTQAELEFFIDPERDEPDLDKVEDAVLKLYPVTEQQKENGEVQELTVREAVEQEVVESEWVAYYLGVAKNWYRRIGIDTERFRFRQHLPDELSHYSSDCWDAESEVDGDWIEITGFSDRASYDLKKHQQYSGEDFKVFREYAKPVTREEATVNPDMVWLGPEYGENAEAIVKELERIAGEEPELFESQEIVLEIDGEKIEIPTEKANFQVEEVKKSGEHIMPEIVEPSFGIDRIFYTVLAHNMEEDEVDGEERTVIKFPAEIAPTEVAVFPLMDKDGLGEKAREVYQELRKAGFTATYDNSGAIGRRYRRQDEVGTPFCITVDHKTLEDRTVTVRDRNSTEQVRITLEKLEGTLEKLVSGEVEFSDL